MTNVVVPECTLKSSAIIFSEIVYREYNVIEFENITVGMVYSNARKGILLGETDLKFLQDIIVASIYGNYRVITLIFKNMAIYPSVWRIMHYSLYPRCLQIFYIHIN